MNGDISDLIRYRLLRAGETLEEARLLAEKKHENAAVNRLYYACFYSLLALLIQADHFSSKHSGVRSLFNMHFVKTGKVSKEMARIYNDLFERRQEGDYDDFVVFEAADVQIWIAEAETFVRAISELIHNKN
jgi:uncharacterized protein (UPF0332 family)